jgi:hypothetical protein
LREKFRNGLFIFPARRNSADSALRWDATSKQWIFNQASGK